MKITDFSENVRLLSFNRFYRFVGSALDIVHRPRPKPDDTPVNSLYETWGVSEKFVTDFRYLWKEYEKYERAGMGYQYRSEYSKFLITHHIPQNIAHLDYLEVMKSDLEALRKKSEFGVPSFFYMTNKNIGPWRSDIDRFVEEEKRIVKGFGLENFGCFDPDDIAARADEYPELVSALVSALGDSDGIVVDMSGSGLNVRPFVSSGVLYSNEPCRDSYDLNVFQDGSMLVGMVNAIQELREIVRFNPTESEINAFLMRHLNILFRDKYTEVRKEVILSPSLKHPDFFLAKHNGLWDVLELKRPVPSRKLYWRDPAGILEMGADLTNSLEQCKYYLRILDSADVRKRLYEKWHIKIDDPHIALVIGQSEYPPGLMELVKQRFDPRIELLSYEQMIKEGEATVEKLYNEIRQARTSIRT